MKKVVSDGVNVERNVLEYDIPTHFVPLPTQGKLYSSDSNLHDAEEIEMRVMTARDEDILTSSALIKKGIAIERLLQNVIVDQSIDVNDLIRGDRDALLMALRITGYGADYPVSVTCPDCSEVAEYSFDLSQLPLKRLQIEPIEPYTNAFSYELPITKKQIVWKFLTGRDENEMTQIQKRKKSSLKLESDNLVTQKLIHSIVAIDGVSDKSKIAAFVRNMPAQDSLKFRAHMDETEAKVEMKQFFTCNACGESGEVAIPMAVTFLWPNAGR